MSETTNKQQLLENFINKYRKDKNDDTQKTTHTHWSNRSHLQASLYVKPEKADEFYQDYNKLLENNIKPGVVQLPQPVQPIVIDLDFKTKNKPSSKQKHLYTTDQIKQFVIDYMYVLQHYLDIPHEEVKIFVFEKSHYTEKKNEETGELQYYKDGIHIIIPQIVVESKVAHCMRLHYLNKEKCESAIEYREKKYMNDMKDCFDRSVIDKSGWFMYGSGKPDDEAYKCYKVIKISTEYDEDEGGFVKFNLECNGLDKVNKKYNTQELILYGTTKYHEDEPQSTVKQNPRILQEYNSILDVQHIYEHEEETRHNSKYDKELLSPDNDKPQLCLEDISYIKRLVLEALDPSRAEDYDKWLEVGWCLFNISVSNPRYTEKQKQLLFQIWDEFSKKCPAKYRPDQCRKWWETKFKLRRMGIGTLKAMARKDNAEKFQEINQKSIFKQLDLALTNKTTDTEVARALKLCYGDVMICADQMKKSWFYFKDHKWHKDEGGFILKAWMSTDFRDKFCDYEIFLTNKEKEYNHKKRDQEFHSNVSTYSSILGSFNNNKQQEEETDLEQEIPEEEDEETKNTINYNDLISKICEKKTEIGKMKLKLQDQSYKKKLLEECLEHFFVQDFHSKLDGDMFLMCFKNGVYDFKNNIFRAGIPDDYVSKSTNINYVEWNPNSKEMMEIQQYLSNVFVDQPIRKYMIDILASCLCKDNQEQAIFFLYGIGSNSKSLLMQLVELCFGDYFTSINTNLFIDNNTNANNPTPDVMLLKGVRLAVAHELREQYHINVANFKRFSGSDKITGRYLRKDVELFTPICRIFATTNSYVPFSENEYAVYRRLKVIPFKSKFVKKEDRRSKNIYEHIMDTDLENKIKQWPEQFMAYLIQSFRALKGKNVYQPQEITDEINKYRESQDLLYQFYTRRIIKINPDEDEEDEMVSLTVIWEAFQQWVTKNRSQEALKPFTPGKLGRFLKDQLSVNEDNPEFFSNIRIMTENEAMQKTKEQKSKDKKGKAKKQVE